MELWQKIALGVGVAGGAYVGYRWWTAPKGEVPDGGLGPVKAAAGLPPVGPRVASAAPSYAPAPAPVQYDASSAYVPSEYVTSYPGPAPVDEVVLETISWGPDVVEWDDVFMTWVPRDPEWKRRFHDYFQSHGGPPPWFKPTGVGARPAPGAPHPGAPPPHPAMPGARPAPPMGRPAAPASHGPPPGAPVAHAAPPAPHPAQAAAQAPRPAAPPAPPTKHT